MKAEELMIGDWVFIKDYPMIAQPMQVKKEHFVRSLVEFEPIPLTPEILKKNGFELEGYGNHEVFELEDFKIYINDLDNFVVCELFDDSDWGWQIIDFCVCHFVHELQHALKLCRIDKEIVV
jgi:hypothetical protein